MDLFQLKLRILSRLFHTLPVNLKGKSRLARFLLGKSLTTCNTSIVSKDGAKYVVPSLKEPIAFHLLIDGIYEKQSIDFVLEQLAPDSVFLDVGANVGVFSITVANFLLDVREEKITNVIAVEASPKIIPYLEKNIDANRLKNITLRRVAITDEDNTTVEFYVPPEDHFGMGSIAPQFDTEPISVSTKTIDTLLKEENADNVRVVKVDVEGYEAAVFRGSQSLLHSTHPPAIIFEFCDWAEARVPNGSVGDAQRVLREAGYQIWRLETFMKGGKPLESVLERGSEMLVGIKHGN